jgi:ribosomal protein S27AE
MYVYRVKSLADEFSVRCPRCGKRAIYAKHAVEVEGVRNRRQTARD